MWEVFRSTLNLLSKGEWISLILCPVVMGAGLALQRYEHLGFTLWMVGYFLAGGAVVHAVYRRVKRDL